MLYVIITYVIDYMFEYFSLTLYYDIDRVEKIDP